MNKLYANRPNHDHAYLPRIVADYTHTPVEFIIAS